MDLLIGIVAVILVANIAWLTVKFLSARNQYRDRASKRQSVRPVSWSAERETTDPRDPVPAGV